MTQPPRILTTLLPVLLFSFFQVASVPAALADPDDCIEADCLRIGAFNIELLGSKRTRNKRPIERRTDAELAELAALIADNAKFDVVALQEINTDSDQWSKLAKLLDHKGYTIAIEGTHSARNQFIVLLYKRGSVRLEPGSAVEIDTPVAYDEGRGCTYDGLRKPVAAHFKADAFDFIVVAVHLKSKSARGIPGWCPNHIRKRQTQDLLAELTKLSDATGEADMILVGDFNAAYDEDSLEPLRDAGYRSQMLYRSSGSGRYSYRKGSNSLIDHVMINPANTSEFVRRSGFVYLVEDDALEDYVRHLSDHMPVWSSFYAGEDDD